MTERGSLTHSPGLVLSQTDRGAAHRCQLCDLCALHTPQLRAKALKHREPPGHTQQKHNLADQRERDELGRTRGLETPQKPGPAGSRPARWSGRPGECVLSKQGFHRAPTRGPGPGHQAWLSGRAGEEGPSGSRLLPQWEGKCQDPISHQDCIPGRCPPRKSGSQ